MIKVFACKILILCLGLMVFQSAQASVSKKEKDKPQVKKSQLSSPEELNLPPEKKAEPDPISAPLKAKNYKALKQQVESLRRHLELEYQKAKRELDSSSPSN